MTALPVTSAATLAVDLGDDDGATQPAAVTDSDGSETVSDTGSSGDGASATQCTPAGAGTTSSAASTAVTRLPTKSRLRRARTAVDELDDFASDFLRLATAVAKGGK